MYENESILDRFSLSLSPDHQTAFTGSYNSWFHLIDLKSGANTQYELNYKRQTISKQIVPTKMITLPKLDYNRKSLAGDFSPKKNTLAVACWNSFFIYAM